MVNENKHIINRKLILVSKGINQRNLARALEITPAAVQQAISGGSTTYRLHRKIADYLGVSMVSFWPELYDNLNVEKQIFHDSSINENVNNVN